MNLNDAVSRGGGRLGTKRKSRRNSAGSPERVVHRSRRPQRLNQLPRWPQERSYAESRSSGLQEFAFCGVSVRTLLRRSEGRECGLVCDSWFSGSGSWIRASGPPQLSGTDPFQADIPPYCRGPAIPRTGDVFVTGTRAAKHRSGLRGLPKSR